MDHQLTLMKKFPLSPGTVWRLTTEFWERRPLSRPLEKRDHPHGAWDLACEVGTAILAPEDGELGTYYATRPKDAMYFRSQRAHHAFYRPFRNYFYDSFGLVYILRGDSGLVHLFAHSYLEAFAVTESIEEHPAQVARRPLTAFESTTHRVKVAELVGYVGNAGYSTGPHIHYEIHEDPWRRWEDRIDPLSLYPEEWEKHKDDLSYDWKAHKRHFKS